jgi:tripartite-type tricarboxylate transporter receptor subunit TctC
MRAIALIAGLLAGWIGLAMPAGAEDTYPSRPITIVVPITAGTTIDILARLYADRLQVRLGQQMVVLNRPGAGGLIGAQAVATAPADGYTLLFANSGHAILGTLNKNLPFDPVRDYAMVSTIGTFDLVFAVNADSPFKTLGDFIAATRRDPGKLNIGTINVGGTQNLGAELLRLTAKLDVQIVPYRNSPDIVVALLRNDMQMLVEFPPAVKGQVADGKLRLLATSGPKRFPSMPDVPTVGEAGVAGYEVTSWNGVFAPKGTKPDVIAVLNTALTEVLALPDIKSRFLDLGVVAKPSTPDELMALLKADVQKWADVIEKAGIEKK